MKKRSTGRKTKSYKDILDKQSIMTLSNFQSRIEDWLLHFYTDFIHKGVVELLFISSSYFNCESLCYKKGKSALSNVRCYFKWLAASLLHWTWSYLRSRSSSNDLLSLLRFKSRFTTAWNIIRFLWNCSGRLAE